MPHIFFVMLLHGVLSGCYWLLVTQLEIVLTRMIISFTLGGLRQLNVECVDFLDDPRTKSTFYKSVDIYCCATIVVRTFARFSWAGALLMSLLVVYSRAWAWQHKEFYVF